MLRPPRLSQHVALARRRRFRPTSPFEVSTAFAGWRAATPLDNRRPAPLAPEQRPPPPDASLADGAGHFPSAIRRGRHTRVTRGTQLHQARRSRGDRRRFGCRIGRAHSRVGAESGAEERAHATAAQCRPRQHAGTCQPATGGPLLGPSRPLVCRQQRPHRLVGAPANGSRRLMQRRSTGPAPPRPATEAPARPLSAGRCWVRRAYLSAASSVFIDS